MFFESGGSKPLPIENVTGAADEVVHGRDSDAILCFPLGCLKVD